MKSALTIIKEQIKSFYLIRRLSVYELKSANSNNYLGILWEIINPMIQITIYWFVFGFVLSSRPPVDGVEYIYWMISGFVVWYFINQAVLQGTKSIFSRIRFISKMSFPMSAIPSYIIFAKFYQHLMLLAVVFVILQFTGFPVSIYFIQMPYFMFATLVLLLALTLITSALATIVRDINMLVPAVMRMMIYMTPILWPLSRIGEEHILIQKLLMLNPFYYVVEGYRSALLGKSGWYLIDHAGYTLYFWVVVIVLLSIGSAIHLKFRDHFVDYL
ncbi:teichoic acid transport system permease protein [Scopulibacillus darangshiensis]|uniref:Transport permease protein n=1 Tax=Scopulibacillus darangshiensis TaxID=442528 RepID=A0A4R2ND80_9BACL|nr:ABC transporter permease [Scopulibacillus darangshiensis]TCP19002.1 teichoic acid transport system permease protein [Scopulibacillus darangshiensis]